MCGNEATGARVVGRAAFDGGGFRVCVCVCVYREPYRWVGGAAEERADASAHAAQSRILTPPSPHPPKPPSLLSVPWFWALECGGTIICPAGGRA